MAELKNAGLRLRFYNTFLNIMKICSCRLMGVPVRSYGKTITLLAFGLILVFVNRAGLANPGHVPHNPVARDPNVAVMEGATWFEGTNKLRGYFKIEERKSKMCLAVANGSMDSDAPVIANQSFSGQACQVWKIGVGRAGYTFTSVQSGMCLSLSNGPGRHLDGQPIVQRPCSDDYTQMWDAGGPRGAFISNHSGKLLTLKGDGSGVIQMRRTGDTNQTWDLTQIQWPPPIAQQQRQLTFNICCDKTTEPGEDEVYFIVVARGQHYKTLTRLPSDNGHWNLNDGNPPRNQNDIIIGNFSLQANDAIEILLVVMEEDRGLVGSWSTFGNDLLENFHGSNDRVNEYYKKYTDIHDSDDLIGAYSVYITMADGKMSSKWTALDSATYIPNSAGPGTHGFRFGGAGSNYYGWGIIQP